MRGDHATSAPAPRLKPVFCRGAPRDSVAIVVWTVAALRLWRIGAPTFAAPPRAQTEPALALSPATTVQETPAWESLPPERALVAESLVEWVRVHGGFVSDDAETVSTEDRGLAVQARRAFKKGELIMRIPEEVDLGTSLAGQTHPLLLALDAPGQYGTRLAAHMVMELDRLAASDPATPEAEGSFDPFWRSIGEKLERSAEHMPFFRSPDDRELLRGTAEFHRPAQYQRQSQLVQELASLQDEGGPEPGLGGLGNATRFIMAHHFISTHVFGDDDSGSHLVPLAIDLNHDVGARAAAAWKWTRGAGGEELRVWARRDVAAGEELTICYGLRSNAQLVSSYGFALEPYLEPLFTFRAASVAELLPEGQPSKDLNFRVVLTTLANDASARPEVARKALSLALGRLKPLRLFLDRATAGSSGLRRGQALARLTEAFRERHEGDATIAPFVAQLRENRARRPASWVWWASEGASDGIDSSSAVALGSRWRSNVVRLKMSEYLCLLAYSEALALREGRLPAAEVLPQAADLLPLLEVILAEKLE